MSFRTIHLASSPNEKFTNSAKFLHVESSGVNGGSAIAGQNVRKLNVEQYNNIKGCVLNADNSFTLPVGFYEIEAIPTGYSIGACRSTIKDSSGNTLITGISAYSSSNTINTLVGDSLHLLTTTNVHIETYAKSAKAGYGLGRAVSDGDPEIYCYVKITKI